VTLPDACLEVVVRVFHVIFGMRFLQDWRGKSGGGIYVGIIYTNFVLLYPNSP
jgi:hypothetical protein